MRLRHAALLALLTGCHNGFKDGVFVKDGRGYQVGDVPAGWKRLDLEDNDLAFASADTPHTIAINSTCKDHGDPPLPVLTQHLLMGFEDRQKRDEARPSIDGREALRTRWSAKLDGVPVELLLVVLKKDGCVYDFTYVSPEGRFDEKVATFDALLGNFHTR